MSKHTPGPWYADKIQDRAAFNIFTPGQCTALLTLEPGKYDGADPRVGSVEANARLIAAAPDLLEALRALLAVAPYHAPGAAHGVMGAEERHASAIKAARAAIAKAEGKE